MRAVQRHLRIVERYSLGRVILLFLAAYIGIVFVFGLIYFLGGLVKDAAGFGECLYFSFITQSTVGYGDLQPVGWGRLLVIIQTTLALLLLAVGTGTILLKLLTPQRDSVEFDEWFLFYPDEKRFRFRYVNRLPVDLKLGRIETRLRYPRVTDQGEKKISRRVVKLLKATITSIPSMQPLISSTRTIEGIKGPEGLKESGELVLEPAYLTPESEVVVTMTAQYFAGNTIATKRWPMSRISCGQFRSTYEDDPSKIEWKNWNAHDLSRREDCEACEFAARCPLREGLQA